MSRRLNGADWPPPVLQKRDRRLALFFFQRTRGIICRGDSTAQAGCLCFCRSATGDLRHFRRTRGRILSRRLNGADGRIRFCRNATSKLRHFSADERDDLAQRFNARLAASGFARVQPASCAIFQRADERKDLSRRFDRADADSGFASRNRQVAASFRGRADGFVAEIQRRRLAASGFARARLATCAIFGGREGI